MLESHKAKERNGVKFTTQIKVRFDDVDAAGVVHYPTLLKYFHHAFEDFLLSEGVSLRDTIEVEKVGFPIVHVEADFKSPLRFEDVLHVSMGLECVGERSATFAYEGRIVRNSEGDSSSAMCARATVKVTCIDMERFAPLAIPNSYRALFETLN